MDEDKYLLKIKKFGYPMRDSTMTTNFCGFYLDKRKNLLKEFQKLYSESSKFDEKRKNSIRSYITSTWVRYEYVLFDVDQIKEIHDTEIDNDTQFLIENITYNFIITVSSILESLAQILHYWYEGGNFKPNLEYRARKDLIDNLKSPNREIYDYLLKENIQKWIIYFKGYRDFIQHRQQVHVMPSEDVSRGTSEMVIELKPGMHDVYPNMDYDSFQDVFLPVYNDRGKSVENINVFCQEHLDKLTEIMETVSKLIIDQEASEKI